METEMRESRRQGNMTPLRPTTPSSNRDPFATPYNRSANTSSTTFPDPNSLARRYFHSRRRKKGEIEKPWLKKSDIRQKWANIFPLLGVFLGLCIWGLFVYVGLKSVPDYNYCAVYEDDFSNGFDTSIWTKDVEVGGFGNGQFEETTGDSENVFVADGALYIKPTLQNAQLVEHNSLINLTRAGTCTTTVMPWLNCVSSTNTTNGTIVNPVRSGRIHTNGSSAKIQFGRVEVVARLPRGDWLWPAIWLLPSNNAYGPWPASGEIDIAESRGNNHSYPLGGTNLISSTLHWGPATDQDHYYQTANSFTALHSTYASGFHTFGLEWTPKYLKTYIDTRLRQVLYSPFTKPFWSKGNFPALDYNGSALVDPWSQTGSDATPFDQPFYLILNVAVGGTNGWFQDGVAGKPWVDASPTARKDFWDAKDQWYPTWQPGYPGDLYGGAGELVVKSVKMWQLGGFRGCAT